MVRRLSSGIVGNCLKACEDFMNALQANGYYELNQSVNNTPAGYRYAYRMGYLYQGSKEVIHSVRVQMGDAFNSSTYFWHNWSDLGRNSYTPTQEYVEMFPWADGKPFNWRKQRQKASWMKCSRKVLWPTITWN